MGGVVKIRKISISLILSFFALFLILPITFATESSAIVIVNSNSVDYADFEYYIQPYLDYFDVPYTILDIFTTPLTASISDYSLIIVGHNNLDTTNTYLNSGEEDFIAEAIINGIGLVNFDGNLFDGSPLYDYTQDIFGFSYGTDYSSSSNIEVVYTDNYITELHTVGDDYGLAASINGVNILSSSPGTETLLNIGSYPLVLVTEYGKGKAVQFTSYEFLDWDIFGYFGGLDDIFWRSFVWAARKPFVMEGMPHFATIRVDDGYGGDTLIEQLSPTGVKGPSGKTEPWSYVKVFNKYGFKPHVAFFLDDISLSWNDSNPYAVQSQIPSTEKWVEMKKLVDNKSMDVSIHAKFGINGGYKDTFFFYNLPSGSEFDDATLSSHFEQANANFSYHTITISKAVIPHFYYIGSKSIPYLSDWGVEFTGNRITVELDTFYGAPYNKFEASNARPLIVDFGYDNGTYKIFNMIAEPLDITYDWLPGVCTFGSPANIATGISRATRVFEREFSSMAPAYLMIHEEYINSCTDSDLDQIMAGLAQNIAVYEPEYVNFDYLSQYTRAKFLSNLSSASYDPSTRNLSVNFVGEADMPTRFYLFTEKPSGEIKSQMIEVPPYTTSTQVTYEFPPEPQFQNQNQNASLINRSESVKLSVEARGKGLQYCSLATNETGSWQTWGSVGSWLQTTQIDFSGGILDNVDTSFSPGDVRLQLPSTIDYGSYTQGTTGLATSICRGGGCSAGTYPVSALFDDINANTVTNCWVSDYDTASNWDEYVNVTIDLTSYRAIDRIIIYNRPSEYFETVYYSFSDGSRYPDSGTLNINSPTTFEHSFSQRTVNQITLHLYGLNLAGNAGICELSIFGSVNTTGEISGSYTSMALDTGASSEYDKLSWSSTTPGSSAIKFQIATNDDAGTWNFLGPDGTPSTYYETSSIIDPIHDEDRYIKYKAFFNTSNSSSMPVLHDVTIDYIAKKYDSPHYLNNATDAWVLTEYIWQNPSIAGKTIGWRVHCDDYNENENVSNEMSFSIMVDNNSPTIVSVTPIGGSTNVTLKNYPIIEFSEPINPGTITGSVDGRPFAAEQAAFDDTGQILTIDLGDMEYEKTYNIIIDSTLEDLDGSQMLADYSFSFTTADRISKLPTSTIELPPNLEPGETYSITGTATGYIWEKDADNPLELRHWDQNGNDVGDGPMLHPTALYFPNGEYGYKFYLVYTPYPPASNENPSLMRSNDGETFTAAGVVNPLFKYNTQPIYDSQNLADPEYLKVGKTWMIFYEMEQSNYGHLGVQFSTDGINYTPYGGPYSPARPTFPFPTDGNPVIYFSNDTAYENDANPLDSYPRLGEPAVIFKDNVYHIWYGSYNSGANAVYANATDPRGPWEKYGPVLSNGRHPDVVYDPERDLYVMWYLCGQNCLATSPTPIGPWTNHPNNPIFSAEGGWEGSSLYRSTLVQVDGQWYLYYSGNPGGSGKIGLAREVPGVKKAEISTNGGASWTQLIVAPDGTWSHPWTPPSTGDYSIKVRVTDEWLVGTPNEAIAHVGQEIVSQLDNPIIVLVDNSVNSFGRYTGEILKAEGINEYQIENINLVNESYLNDFDIVILTSMSITPSQVPMLQNYVASGGNLIGFKPDLQLSSLFGLTPIGTTTSEGYIKVDDTTDIGKGIVSETMQFHWEADNYNLDGAAEIARLYSDAATSTSYPAMTINDYGSGKAVAFTYDLSRSTVLLRQGNPALAGTGPRPSDLLENYLDADKIPIPQADEQMRLLTNAIFNINDKKPLPRFWYFPDFEKTMVILTGDQDGSSLALINQEIEEIEERGGKFSFYLTSWPSLSDVQNWTDRGHEIGRHFTTSSSYAAMDATYTSDINTFQSNYGFTPRTTRHHALMWFDYAGPAQIQESHGIQMDFNYYHWSDNAAWFASGGFKNGWMTGSGIPMKFVSANGSKIYESYQVMTNFCDECQVGAQGLSGAQAALVAARLFNKSRDGFYTAFGANFHPVSWSGQKRLFGLGLMDYAVEYGIPLWNSQMLLDFVDAKSNAVFENITYEGSELKFILKLPNEINNLTVMVPSKYKGRTISGITLNSAPQTFGEETIKGIEYAWFVVNSIGSYEVVASYSPDTTPPVITIIYPINGTTLPGVTTSTSINITTDENADCRYSRTNPTFDYETVGVDFTYGQGTTKHSLILSGLDNNNTYDIYYRCNDTYGNINSVSTHHWFSIAFLDTLAPEWRNQGQNASSIQAGESVLLYAQGKDETALSQAILSTNESGSWQNFTGDTWFNPFWQYKIPITITENSGSDLSDYQVSLDVSYVPSKMNSDFSDLRFTDNSGNLLHYWIENYTPGTSANVWVKVPGIPASSSATIYMYYGNPGAGSASNGTATFEFFDDFSGTTLDSSKWTEDAVNDITQTVNDYFRFEDATKSTNAYFIFDGTDTGSQHQAKWTPTSEFVVEFNSRINNLVVAEMGEGMVGLVASDNTVIGVAGHHDWSGDSFLSWRGVVTENSASSLGAGVSKHGTHTTTAYKDTSNTDETNWKIVNDGSTLKFYDNDGFFAEASISSPVSKLSLIAGGYGPYVYLDYIQIDAVKVRKYASLEPSISMGSEDSFQTTYGSPMDMGGTTDWTWSNFTWQNPSIPNGTDVAWKIYYIDTSDNVNVTDTITFRIGEGPVCETTADTNGDGDISMPELMAYIGRWKAGEIEMPDLMKAIGYWKDGVGC